MSNHQYLIRRGNAWSAVVEVPKPLRPLLNGKSRFIRALGTSSLAEANRLKLPLVAEWKRQIAVLEKQGKPDPLAKAMESIAAYWPEIKSASAEWEEMDHGREFNLKDWLISMAKDDARDLEREGRIGDATPILKRGLGQATLIRDLYPSWIAEFVGKQQTKDQGAFAIRQYLKWAGELAASEDVTRKKAGEFIGHLLATSGLSQRTIERYASSLSSFWRWMIRRGHLDTDANPWRGHELGRGSKKTKRRPLPDEVVLKLLRASYAPSGQRAERRYETVLPDVLRIALATGMRLGEICELERSDVERRADGLWLNIGEGKTEAAERSVPVHPVVAAIVERRLKDGDQYLIANLVRGGSDKRRGHHVSKAFARFREGAGVTEKGQVFHALRNTFIACMEGHGVPESTTKLLVGHARESMTYGHYSDGQRVDLRKAIDRLDYGTEIMSALMSPSCARSRRYVQ